MRDLTAGGKIDPRSIADTITVEQMMTKGPGLNGPDFSNRTCPAWITEALVVFLIQKIEGDGDWVRDATART